MSRAIRCMRSFTTSSASQSMSHNDDVEVLASVLSLDARKSSSRAGCVSRLRRPHSSPVAPTPAVPSLVHRVRRRYLESTASPPVCSFERLNLVLRAWFITPASSPVIKSWKCNTQGPDSEPERIAEAGRPRCRRLTGR